MHDKNNNISIFSARARSMTGGHVFTPVCPFTGEGEGVIQSLFPGHFLAGREGLVRQSLDPGHFLGGRGGEDGREAGQGYPPTDTTRHGQDTPRAVCLLRSCKKIFL